jgi:hypothetical protein
MRPHFDDRFRIERKLKAEGERLVDMRRGVDRRAVVAPSSAIGGGRPLGSNPGGGTVWLTVKPIFRRGSERRARSRSSRSARDRWRGLPTPEGTTVDQHRHHDDPALHQQD